MNRRLLLAAPALALLLPTAAHAAATPSDYDAVGPNWHRAHVARVFGSHGWREAHWQQNGHANEMRAYPTTERGVHANVHYAWCRRDQAWEVKGKELCSATRCWL